VMVGFAPTAAQAMDRLRLTTFCRGQEAEITHRTT
jgi:hypothetical protein